MHQQCCEPALDVIPENDWFCELCCGDSQSPQQTAAKKQGNVTAKRKASQSAGRKTKTKTQSKTQSQTQSKDDDDYEPEQESEKEASGQLLLLLYTFALSSSVPSVPDCMTDWRQRT